MLPCFTVAMYLFKWMHMQVVDTDWLFSLGSAKSIYMSSSVNIYLSASTNTAKFGQVP